MKKSIGYRAGQTVMLLAALGFFPAPGYAGDALLTSSGIRQEVPRPTLSLKMFRDFPAYREIVLAYEKGVSPVGLVKSDAEKALWQIDRIRTLVEKFAREYKVFSNEDRLRRTQLQGLMDEIMASTHGAHELCHMLPSHVRMVEKILGVDAPEHSQEEQSGEKLHVGF